MSEVFLLRCPSCGSIETLSLGRVPPAFHFCQLQLDHDIGSCKLGRCQQCSLVFKDSSLSDSLLNDYYERQPAGTWSDNVESRADFERVIEAITQVQRKEPCTILDVGCFDGAFLDVLRKRLGTSARLELFGIEPSVEAAARARSRSVHILGQSFEALTSCEKTFDVVVCTDVFEHIRNTRHLFQALSAVLNDGGHLFLVTGAIDSKAVQTYLSKRRYVTMPEHLSFLSKKHAEWLAGQTGLHLKNYSLISRAHSSHVRPLNILRNALFVFSGLLPAGLVAKSRFARLRRIRSSGLLPVLPEPDHALAVFSRVATDSLHLCGTT